ncbi:PD-(D/E)XK nuclease family protein [Winogradskyella sp. UBA3174]|uniref:PD-(D/E)XK nuclease family protein n=1 Tax=Winogradskyella sp. UBA3174 TaxID=1947785 RepID=UPI0025FB54F8|nr:PD-(D/E)XK nuclease family protein [Winogradskyella sp. UBA3174]|tara:strand:- start:35873 stop:38635 length:2763 start_codon:yes stop_codon:yes gene_type:complete
MDSFIKTVLTDLQKKNLNLEDLNFILPSKRAGVFLKHQLAHLLTVPVFVPQIVSIEEFVEELSGLKTITNVELLFELYTSYKSSTNANELESFESFSKWAQILLQDFNEIDRYLVPQQHIFDYLKAIKEINHWSLNNNQTDLIKTHLKFWNKLKTYYKDFRDNLLKSKRGYQGLIYREAAENLEVYIEHNSTKNHVFLGFNALNTAESQIIQGLLQNDIAHIYWDIDKVFIEDPIHDAGLFTRKHLKEWNYFQKQPFNWVSSHYTEDKNIEVIGIPKFVGQAKHIGQLLKEISTTNKNLSSVAVILGEENLLIPVLNSIPRQIKALNVTMGLPLKFVPLASLFEYLFSLHKSNPDHLYYKDIIDILTHPSIYNLLNDEENDNGCDKIIEHIQQNNLVYVKPNDLKKLCKLDSELISLLFGNWEDNPDIALKNCSKLIFSIKTNYDNNKTNNSLELEYLYRFNILFNQLSLLNNSHKHLNSIAVLHSIFIELLSSETLDFKGEPLEGLQIMGMLESRVLDFETVIISSVNEGILPSGKTNNSFIPFDVKIENGLPTYKEKDAVYTYHFYRLLQRAKNVYILYNTEVDALKGGEKSRFITQLEIEEIHDIKHSILSSKVPLIKQKLKQITKTNLVLEKLKAVALRGFSPSSLTNYIRNPIDFYYEKILDIKTFEDVEENIAANTLGTVIHDTLEDFYKPFEGHFLTVDILKDFKNRIKETVTRHFKNLYKDGDFTKGKNLIIYKIAQRYILNFIISEIESLNNGNNIKIIAIEVKNTIDIKIEELNFPIKLTGKVDRVDECNGITRVIDYKSGKVEQSKVEIADWENLITDYDKYSKSFQILSYAYMMHQNKRLEFPIEAGIISFKNLGAGLLKFGKKPSTHSRTKDQLVTEETLQNFEIELKKLIVEICNPQLDFIENKLS